MIVELDKRQGLAFRDTLVGRNTSQWQRRSAYLDTAMHMNTILLAAVKQK
jgi:hypothetical protein